MIKFDIEKIEVSHALLKSMTTALGGSIRLVDEVELEKTGIEVLVKHNCPMAVVRAASLIFKRSKFFDPIQCAITRYDGHIVSIELNTLDNDLYRADMIMRDGLWWSNSEHNVERHLETTAVDTDEWEWFTDGKMVYPLPLNIDEEIRLNGDQLSSDNRFHSYHVDGYKLQSLCLMSFEDVIGRHILAFRSPTGEFVLTPPIWKSLDKIGSKQLSSSSDGTETIQYPFDRIDSLLSVNLNFALSAARDVSVLFGYDAVAPLRLPSLMIQLNTVNLPKVPVDVKATFDVGMPFTYGLAWLIGLLTKVDNLDDMLVLRGTIKYLTTKGIFFNSLFESANIFVNTVSLNHDVVSMEQALSNAAEVKIPVDYLSSMSSAAKKDVNERLVDAE